MDSLLILFAMALAIFLGEWLNVNTGFIALSFAYIIGCFVLGMSTKELLATWPTQLFLVIFAVSLFFNFVVVNGALNKMADLLLYRFKKFTLFLPLILYFITALVSGLGAGFFTSVAIVGAIAMALCESSGMNRMHVSLSVSLGALSGANFMPSAHGVLFDSLLKETSLASISDKLTQQIFIVSFVYPIFVILALIPVSRKKLQQSEVVIDKPSAFDAKQRLNLLLIFLLMLTVLFVPALKPLFGNAPWIVFISDRIDISFLAIVFAVIAYFCKLTTSPQKVLEKIPWNTIWLVCGVGMLIDVAVKARTIEDLAQLITRIPTPLVPVTVCAIAGVMSIFSSTLGVVAPPMFPMIAGICASSGYSPTLIAVAIIIGAQATSVAPFSTGGSLILGASGLQNTEQKRFYDDLLYKATPIGLASP